MSEVTIEQGVASTVEDGEVEQSPETTHEHELYRIGSMHKRGVQLFIGKCAHDDCEHIEYAETNELWPPAPEGMKFAHSVGKTG